MAKYIGDVISQINYNANFNYIIDELPNPTYKNDSEAAKKWTINRNKHVKSVIYAWSTDTKIETSEEYQQGNHVSPLSLKDIALKEFNIDRDELVRIEKVLQTHDRSRFADDEFFPMANWTYSPRIGEQPIEAYNISRLKHYQRNAHHLEHYVFFNINTTRPAHDTYAVQMPDNYIWELIADWLSNPDLTYGMYAHSPQPFYFYWRSKYKFLYVRHTFWDSGVHYDDSTNESGSNTEEESTSRSLDETSEVESTLGSDTTRDSSDTDTSETTSDEDDSGSTSNGYTVYSEYEYYTKEPLEPVLPKIIPIHPITAARIEQIVDRWQPRDDRDPSNYPDLANARKTGNTYVVPDAQPSTGGGSSDEGSSSGSDSGSSSGSDGDTGETGGSPGGSTHVDDDPSSSGESGSSGGSSSSTELNSGDGSNASGETGGSPGGNTHVDDDPSSSGGSGSHSESSDGSANQGTQGGTPGGSTHVDDIEGTTYTGNTNSGSESSSGSNDSGGTSSGGSGGSTSDPSTSSDIHFDDLP